MSRSIADMEQDLAEARLSYRRYMRSTHPLALSMVKMDQLAGRIHQIKAEITAAKTKENALLKELLTYDPSSLNAEQREQMAGILKARGEILRASAEVSDLRARAWAGEEGMADLIELKAADLAKLREDYMNQVRPFISTAVNVEGLTGLLPMMAMAVLQNFNIPLPVVMEALGIDVDQIKLLVDKGKEVFDEM